MPVYVDQAQYQVGRMLMCHMLADTPLELFDMASAIEVDHRWFQKRASSPHFDICKEKRKLAVALGAIEVDRRGLMEVIKSIRASRSWHRGEDGWCGPKPVGYVWHAESDSAFPCYFEKEFEWALENCCEPVSEYQCALVELGLGEPWEAR